MLYRINGWTYSSYLNTEIIYPKRYKHSLYYDVVNSFMKSKIDSWLCCQFSSTTVLPIQIYGSVFSILRPYLHSKSVSVASVQTGVAVRSVIGSAGRTDINLDLKVTRKWLPWRLFLFIMSFSFRENIVHHLILPMWCLLTLLKSLPAMYSYLILLQQYSATQIYFCK